MNRFAENPRFFVVVVVARLDCSVLSQRSPQ